MTQVKVTALMTAPRYEAVFARNMIERSMKQLGIPLHISGGVFYGQCMQTMLVDAIKDGAKYAVTVDFDSIFTPADVMHLLATIEKNDHIDAVACIQSRRGSKFPLFMIQGQSEITTNGEPFEVSTAHFGLTVIDLEKLAGTPKPWFWSTPTDDGEWERNKSVDDDIYFWRNWSKAGRTIYIDPVVKIGHLEEVIAVYDDNMQHQFIYPNQWIEANPR